MPFTITGFAFFLNEFCDATNGINKILPLTNIYPHNYVLVGASALEYSSATNKINLTISVPVIPPYSAVEQNLASNYPSDYADYIAEDWDSTTVIKATYAGSDTYLKAYYPTKQNLTFDAATSNDVSGSIEASSVPHTFDIKGGQYVQAVGLYHDTTLIDLINVDDVMNANDYKYVIDSLTINVT